MFSLTKHKLNVVWFPLVFPRVGSPSIRSPLSILTYTALQEMLIVSC